MFPLPRRCCQLRDNLARSGTSGLASQGARRHWVPCGVRDIIIETDYELFQRLGSATAVHGYVTDLMAYVVLSAKAKPVRA